ncbi:MAG: hypothetical protein LBH01_04360 [Verrucomicrobiales bacterium]|nr:hypothetical protein [Verrucomicrobiales bacterium]
MSWAKIKGWLGLLGIFAAGVLLGATLMVVCFPHRPDGPKPPPPRPEQIAEKLTSELNLTELQKQHVLAILQATNQQFRQLGDQKRQERMVIFEKSRQLIRAELNPDQQLKYDEMMRRLNERWNRDHKERRD